MHSLHGQPHSVSLSSSIPVSFEASALLVRFSSQGVHQFSNIRGPRNPVRANAAAPMFRLSTPHRLQIIAHEPSATDGGPIVTFGSSRLLLGNMMQDCVSLANNIDPESIPRNNNPMRENYGGTGYEGWQPTGGDLTMRLGQSHDLIFEKNADLSGLSLT
ncbi:uncharacterized protein RSE6_13433 [Rhynchosporium secalis]|uniref:Uncharacterized protein n=1 Tax=Rhynchosporium secalis TaxID=38038 RepID=A0A1E1MSV8_RHYSE|nr:uncharacterized protein RSE6_13433 [Rhynchosporium secalis]